MDFKGEKYAKFCMLLPAKHTKLNWGLEKVGKKGDGGSAETRTLDRRIKSPLLYQLSYAPNAMRFVKGLVGAQRLELWTDGLRVRCSTN